MSLIDAPVFDTSSRSRRATTAHQLRDLRAATAAPDQRLLAHVGIALHHFTEILQARQALPATEIHRATAVLTKQVGDTLQDTLGFDALHRLVTDPERPATPDGRTAEQVCGTAWAGVRESASEQATAAASGSSTYGETCVLQLAALHASRSVFAWWGTSLWDQRVDTWLAANRSNSGLRNALRDAPETLGAAVLADVLNR